MKNQPGRGPCYADPQVRARRAGRSLGTAMADDALTLERKCGYTSGKLRGPDRTVKEILPETPPTVVGHGILGDSMLYLTVRRAVDGMLFRVFLNPDDLRRLLNRAMERNETAAIVREIAADQVDR